MAHLGRTRAIRTFRKSPKFAFVKTSDIYANGCKQICEKTASLRAIPLLYQPSLE